MCNLFSLQITPLRSFLSELNPSSTGTSYLQSLQALGACLKQKTVTHERKAEVTRRQSNKQGKKAVLKTKDFHSGIITVKQVTMKDLGAGGVGSSVSAP